VIVLQFRPPSICVIVLGTGELEAIDTQESQLIGNQSLSFARLSSAIRNGALLRTRGLGQRVRPMDIAEFIRQCNDHATPVSSSASNASQRIILNVFTH
jgi:predicted RNA-binding Zn ribbon-like protein